MNIESVASQLRAMSVAYYRGQPIASDEEFDALRAKLKKYAPDHAVLKEIGAPPCNTLKKVKHRVMCGSLDNTFDEEGIRAWLDKMVKAGAKSVVVEPKMDGLTMSLTYQDGTLIRAATRGDGAEGEDVTGNALRMPSIPYYLTSMFSGEVRGECVVTIKKFNKYFKPRGDANPRNSAAGTLRRTDGELANKLTFIAFDIIPEDAEDAPTSEMWAIDALDKLGFVIPEVTHWNLAHYDTILGSWSDAGKAKESPDRQFDMDGIVLKVNDRKVAAKMGVIDGCPRAALACKWKGSMVAETEVIGIENQVGRTGRITPVVIVKPVTCGGVTVSKANLMNWDEVGRLPGVGVGAKVRMERCGDVIPRCVAVLSPSKQPFTRPDSCPSCGAETHANGPFQLCVNPACPAQSFRTVMNWVKGRNILHLGESTVDALMSLDGPVAEIDDLYKLTVDDIAKATGSFATARKILESLEKSKTCTAAQFIGNLGIPGIGESEAQKALDGGGVVISRYMDKNLLEVYDDKATDAIGPERGMKLWRGLEKRDELINRLLKHMEITAPKKGKTDGAWAGKTYCITGAGELPRESVKDILNKAGGIWKSSVVNGLDYLICNEEGTTKAKAASAKGITVITEQQALDMAGYR